MKPRNHKLAVGQEIYLWNEEGNPQSGERRYRVVAAPVTWYILEDVGTLKRRLIADTYSDLYDPLLHVLESVDMLPK
jgi:hypothetical protein